MGQVPITSGKDMDVTQAEELAYRRPQLERLGNLRHVTGGIVQSVPSGGTSPSTVTLPNTDAGAHGLRGDAAAAAGLGAAWYLGQRARRDRSDAG